LAKLNYKMSRTKIIDYEELSLLECAKQSCITARLVSDKQAKIIKSIVEKLKELGVE